MTRRLFRVTKACAALAVWSVLTSCSRQESEASVQPAGAAQPASAPSEREPAQIYAQICAACHEGQVPKAPHSVTFQMLGAEAILAALTNGVMQAQGSMLTAQERRALAEHLGGHKLSSVSSQPPARCADGTSPFDAERPPVTRSWGMTLANTRFVAEPGLRAADVPKLQLQWAFAYPGATRARSQPAVAAGAIYVGSQSGEVYALDFISGCVRWNYRAAAEVRVAPSIETWRQGDATAQPRLFFGDLSGNVYALNARNGSLLWQRRVDAHARLTITGSPREHGGVVYVPMSSTEWAAAADPAYECCSFRGGVVALDAATGREIWKTYTIAAEPRLTGEKNSAGTARRAPAGAPVWNSPTIDEKRGRLYVGTGEAYTSPAADTSDAVLAFDLKTGKRLWHYQSIANDAWNMACFIGGGPNCPKENGPDLDIGAPPVLVTLPSGDDILVVGQKSADVFGLDPQSGKLIWRRRTGRGGFAGGVHWGLAAEGPRIYATSADTLFLPSDAQRGEARPGLFALNAANGKTEWFTPSTDQCPAELKPACDPGISAPATAMPGLVFTGGFDGRLRAYEATTGSVVWEFDTVRAYESLSGEQGRGGSIESAGVLVADGAVLVNSGYLFGGRLPGECAAEVHCAGRRFKVSSQPKLEDFDLMSPATQACPYSFYERLRDEAPVYRMPWRRFLVGYHLRVVPRRHAAARSVRQRRQSDGAQSGGRAPGSDRRLHKGRVAADGVVLHFRSATAHLGAQAA